MYASVEDNYKGIQAMIKRMEKDTGQISELYTIVVSKDNFENAKLATKMFNHDMKHRGVATRCCIKKY